MRKYLLAVLTVSLLFLALSAPIGLALPPLGVGLKFPLAGLASCRIGDNLALEVSVPLALGGLVAFETSLDAKLYLGTLTLADLSLRPFVGGGATLISAVGQWVPGARLLTGMEYRSPQLPINIFAQITGSLISSGSPPIISIEGNLGARYDF
jgi:hypothetical protein